MATQRMVLFYNAQTRAGATALIDVPVVVSAVVPVDLPAPSPLPAIPSDSPFGDDD